MGVEPNAWSRALPVLCADLLRHWERDARFLCCQKIHIQFSNAEPGGSAYLPRSAFRNYAAARPGGRVIQSISQRVGGHMGPSLRLKRTTLITGSAPLIRLAFGPPLPLLAFSYFPLTGGIGLPQRGKLYGRVLDPPLRRIQNGFVFLVGAGPRPARQDSHRERWLVKARRRN